MAWYPEAVRKPLTTRPKRAMVSPRRINLHTAVSSTTSLFGYWQSNSLGVFSHFYVREDGTVEQYQDTRYRAACDLDGNPDTISIESWDGYKSSQPNSWLRPWTDAQVSALVKLVRWIMTTHDTIPKKLATNNRATGNTSWGLSYHQLGSPGFMAYDRPAGLRYTNANKKVCPGAQRISQIPVIFSRAMNTTAGPVVPPKEEESIMPQLTSQELDQKIFTQARAALIAVLQEPRYAEYVDENGNQVRDVRALSDILFSTHANSVMANRNVLAMAEKAGVDTDKVVSAVLAAIHDQMIDISIEEGIAQDVADKVFARIQEQFSK